MPLPGPLGDPLAISLLFQVFAQAVTPIAITDPKPRPTDSVTTYFPAIVDDPLLGKPLPEFKQVNQGNIGNCPVTAVLAAMARAKPNDLKNMITKVTGQVVAHTPVFSGPPAPPKFNHFFKVTFPGSGPIVVGPLLYQAPRSSFSTDPLEIMYAHSPGKPSVASWASLLEKAYVIKKDTAPQPQNKSYSVLDGGGKGLDPIEVMNDIAGTGAEWILDPAVDPGAVMKSHPWTPTHLSQQFARANTVPMIAATRSDQKDIDPLPMLKHHDYAVIGMLPSGKVQLYNCHELSDTNQFKNPALTMAEFQKACLMVVLKP